jgi:hypothetical protein
MISPAADLSSFTPYEVRNAIGHAKSVGWREIARRAGVKLARREEHIQHAIEADRAGWTYAASRHQDKADCAEASAALLDHAARVAFASV